MPSKVSGTVPSVPCPRYHALDPLLDISRPAPEIGFGFRFSLEHRGLRDEETWGKIFMKNGNPSSE